MQINTSALINNLVSPCRSCDNCQEPKGVCMEDCPSLSQFRHYLSAYSNFTLGCYDRIGDVTHSIIL